MLTQSYKINTHQNLVEPEKAVKTLPMARIPTAFLILPNFHKCFYNSIETRYMFSILIKIIVRMSFHFAELLIIVLSFDR